MSSLRRVPLCIQETSKLDQTPIDGVTPDYAAITRFGKSGVDLLLSDSTNATVPGFTKSEAEVGHSLYDAIKNADGRVFVASFSVTSIVFSRSAMLRHVAVKS